MGLFDFFKRKKNKQAEEPGERVITVSLDSLADKETREAFVVNNCEVIVDAEKKMFDARKEYQAVTCYLSDIQKIDLMPEKARKELNECAQRIINLNDERKTMQHTPSKITLAQKIALETAENDLQEELNKIVDSESYRLIVESDMRTIEGERDALDYEISETLDKDYFNRKILIIATVFIVIALGFLIAVSRTTTTNVLPVYALIILFGAVSAAYFLISHKKNEQFLIDNQKKLNRAVFLLNKVKIKYVNVVNMLDYNYEKYHVVSAKELKFNIKEYQRILDEEKRFKKAEDLIDFYNNELKSRLKNLTLEDPGIWIYQCEALIDEKEMVEVRHRLNVRRQKLRKQIDSLEGQVSRARLNISNMLSHYPEYDYETRMIMNRYELTYKD